MTALTALMPDRTVPRVMVTTAQADGALPNGTRVEKANSDLGDSHQDGDLATVLGSVAVQSGPVRLIGYFVAWDDLPAVPCFIGGTRLRRID